MELKSVLKVSVCVGLAFLLIGSMSVAAQAQTKGSGAKVLKVGSLKSLTGWYSFLDAPDSKDLQHMADIINAKGGVTVKGQRYNIEIVLEDNKSSLEGTTAGATRLAFDKKVKFVLGPGAYFGPAAGAIFNANKVLYVLDLSACQPGDLGPYGFLGGLSTLNGSSVPIRAMKMEFPNVKKVAIITPDDGTNATFIPLVKNVLAQNGITQVGDLITYSNEIQDCSPIAAKANAVKDADAILQVNGAPPHFGNIVKALRELGNTKPYVGGLIMEPPDLIAITGKSAATNVLTCVNQPNAPGNPAYFDEVYNKRTGAKQIYAPLGPSGLLALVGVIKAADSIDPDVVRATWEKMKTVDTIFGKGTISGEQTYGIKGHAMSHALQYQVFMNGEATYKGWLDPGPLP
ncbi:MAG: ABC transporter substrate-binding protein [Thermodesulfobacteriota bacterium]|jgi:branched-chain amino acid transport system substrate-binding protein